MNVICNGAQCTTSNPDVIATGQENYFSVTFSFNSEWNSLTKTVYFSRDNIEEAIVLIGDTCNLPIRLTEGFGDIYVGVVGKLIDTDGIFPDETIVLTTNKALLCSLLQGPNLTVAEIKEKINLIS